MVAVVDLIAMVSTVRAMLATVVVCWLVHAGFVLGRHGDLVLDAESRDFGLVLLAAGASSAVIAFLLRVGRRESGVEIPVQRSAAGVRACREAAGTPAPIPLPTVSFVDRASSGRKPG
ncbi:hypothetical protein ACQPW3_24715 [Actinosynnema sp. CA-248983]